MKNVIQVLVVSLFVVIIQGCSQDVSQKESSVNIVDTVGLKYLKSRYYTVIARYNFYTVDRLPYKYDRRDTLHTHLLEYSHYLNDLSTYFVNIHMEGVNKEGVIVDPFVKPNMYKILDSLGLYDKSRKLNEEISDDRDYFFVSYCLRTIIINDDALLSKKNIVHFNVPEMLSMLSLVSNMSNVYYLKRGNNNFKKIIDE